LAEALAEVDLRMLFDYGLEGVLDELFELRLVEALLDEQQSIEYLALVRLHLPVGSMR